MRLAQHVVGIVLIVLGICALGACVSVLYRRQRLAKLSSNEVLVDRSQTTSEGVPSAEEGVPEAAP